jgi:hypothetical protein
LGINPVGGTAALREHRLRRDRKWLKGATGEYLMDVSLHQRLNGAAIILTDRQVPGARSNFDHIVVAPSGVWIIDSKKWSGRIQYKSASFTDVNMHLYVGGKDRTSEIESIYALVIPLAQVVDDPSIPIHPALVFIEGDWSGAVLPRFIMGKPYKHEGVYISGPKVLIKKINEPGPLDAESINRLASKLDSALKPR